NLSVPEELRPHILDGRDRRGWRSDEPPGKTDRSRPGEKERLGNMAQRVTAIFPNREDAERAADALVDLGADRSQISTLERGQDGMDDRNGWTGQHDAHRFVEPAREVGDSGAPLTTSDEPDAAQGAATGAAIGAVAGIAAGLASLMVPG